MSLLQVFEKVERDEVALQARYNLGNSRFRQGEYQKAIDAYESVLQEDPENKDARYNMSLARTMLAEAVVQEEEVPEEEQEKQEQDKQKQEKEKQEKKEQ